MCLSTHRYNISEKFIEFTFSKYGKVESTTEVKDSSGQIEKCIVSFESNWSARHFIISRNIGPGGYLKYALAYGRQNVPVYTKPSKDLHKIITITDPLNSSMGREGNQWDVNTTSIARSGLTYGRQWL